MFKSRQKEAAVQADAGQKKVFERVQLIIAEQINVDPEDIKEDTVLDEDLQIDELDIFEIALELEDVYEIEIPGDCQKWVTVRDIMDTLRENGVK